MINLMDPANIYKLLPWCPGWSWHLLDVQDSRDFFQYSIYGKSFYLIYFLSKTPAFLDVIYWYENQLSSPCLWTATVLRCTSISSHSCLLFLLFLCFTGWTGSDAGRHQALPITMLSCCHNLQTDIHRN